DRLATREAGRNFHLDVLAGRKMHAGLGALGGFRQADGHLGMQILAAAGGAEIFRLELRPEAARTAARRAAEHVAQHALEAAAATPPAGRALEAVVAEGKAFELARARPPAARLRAEAFVALEARLALGVDLAI